MAFDTAKVIQGWDGVLWTAPPGTPIPPTLADPVAGPWVNVGWCHEDGHSFNPNLQSQDPIRAWPRGEVVKRPAPTLEPEFTYQLLQHTDALYQLVTPGVERAWILEYRDTATSDTHRLIIPKAMMTEAGEVAFNTADPIGHEFTVGASRDDTAVVGGPGSEVTGFTFAFVVPDPAGDVIREY